jgi:SAM-dependent methyltransferase
MAITNTEMAAAWDGPEGDHWTEQAERYESVGPLYWDALADAVGIQPRDDVLDVGCGTGRSTRDAARLAVDGSVLGVDLSRRMLDRARARARAEGLTNVRFEHADAQVHPFERDAFGVVVSNFGAMFFADPVAAFANLAGAMRPGGRLGLLAWRQLSDNEWLTAIRGALSAGRKLPTPPIGVPGPFGLADETQTRTILEAAGLVDILIERIDAPLRFGDDAEDAFAFLSALGIARGLLQELDPSTAADATEELRRTIDEHQNDDGVTFGGSAWIITARSGR